MSPKTYRDRVGHVTRFGAVRREGERNAHVRQFRARAREKSVSKVESSVLLLPGLQIRWTSPLCSGARAILCRGARIGCLSEH